MLTLRLSTGKKLAGRQLLIEVWDLVTNSLRGSACTATDHQARLAEERDKAEIRDVAAELINALIEKCSDNERLLATSMNLNTELYVLFQLAKSSFSQPYVYVDSASCCLPKSRRVKVLRRPSLLFLILEPNSSMKHRLSDASAAFRGLLPSSTQA